MRLCPKKLIAGWDEGHGKSPQTPTSPRKGSTPCEEESRQTDKPESEIHARMHPSPTPPSPPSLTWGPAPGPALVPQCLHNSQRNPIKFPIHSWAQTPNMAPPPGRNVAQAIADAASLPHAPRGLAQDWDRAPQAGTELFVCKSDPARRNPTRGDRSAL